MALCFFCFCAYDVPQVVVEEKPICAQESVVKTKRANLNGRTIVGFSLSGRQYISVFDVQNLTYGRSYVFEDKEDFFIHPVCSMLHDCALRGFYAQSDSARVDIKDVFFCIYDLMGVSGYKRDAFYSEELDEFVMQVCPTLKPLNFSQFFGVDTAVTEDTLKSFFPEEDETISWSLLDSVDFNACLENKNGRDVFLFLPQTGVLQGCVVPKSSIKHRGKSVFDDKMLAMRENIAQTYPVSKELWEKTVNNPFTKLTPNFCDVSAYFEASDNGRAVPCAKRYKVQE